MMNGYGCGWGITGMGLGGLLGLLIVVALVASAVLGGVWLARRGRTTDGGTRAAHGDPARDRLRQRYAEGEVDEEEFERRLAALTWK